MDENEKIPALLIISGPTASGKSTLAEEIALRYNLPIISADSRQIYRGFDIGTAKPSPEIRSKIRYEMIDILEPDESFSAGKFARGAAHLIQHTYYNEPIIIIAGGTGFYITALMDGLADIPDIRPEINQKWNDIFHERGIGYVQKEMKVIDPVFMIKGAPENPHRLLRAAKIVDQTGRSIFEYKPKSFLDKSHPTRYIALHHERNILYDRIDRRVDIMMERGLIDEIQSLLNYRNCPAMRTVGYKEFLPYFEEKISLAEAIEQVKQHSRNYAKRQLTWLRSHGSWQWIPPGNSYSIITWLQQFV